LPAFEKIIANNSNLLMSALPTIPSLLIEYFSSLIFLDPAIKSQDDGSEADYPDTNILHSACSSYRELLDTLDETPDTKKRVSVSPCGFI